LGLSVKPAGPPPATRDEQIAKQRRSIHQCGRGAVLVAAADWSEVLIVPMKCKNWRCPYCGPRLRNSWAWKIAQANPERLITLTADPALHESPRAAYETMRAALPKLIRTLRKIGITHSAKFFPHPDATLDLEPKQDQYITWIRWETADTIDFLIQKCGYGLIPPYSGDGIHLANVSGPAGLRTIERIEAYFRDGY